MLEDIISSKTDSAVLAFLLSAPPRAFSLYELSRRLSIPRLNTAKTLSKLLGQGLIKTFVKKGQKYYLINQKYRLLAEMKKRMSVARDSDELFSAIKRLKGLRAAFLSGLFSGYSHLPVDILLVGRLNLKQVDGFLKSAQKLMGQEINYSIMTPEEFLQRRHTFDRFIKDIFDYHYLTVVDKLAKNKT